MKDLFFVYNAESSYINMIFDAGHKIISPGNYNRQLCALTHGKFGEKKEWKNFREGITAKTEFLHRDQFEIKFGVKYEYPVVLKKESGAFKIVLTRDDISQFNNVDEPINYLKMI